MSPLLLFLVGVVPAFAAGALARPYIDRLVEEARMSTTEKPRRLHIRVIPVLLAFTTLVSCSALIYTVNASHRTDAQYDTLVDCVTTWSKESSGTTLARAQAARDRDDALVASKRAMRQWVRRILAGEQWDNSEAIRQSAWQYIAQTGKFIEASEEFNRIREQEPVTLFDADYCRKVAEDD